MLQTFFDVITYSKPAAAATASGGEEDEEEQEMAERTKNRGVVGVTKPVAWLVVLSLLGLFFFYTIHCNWVTRR